MRIFNISIYFLLILFINIINYSNSFIFNNFIKKNSKIVSCYKNVTSSLLQKIPNYNIFNNFKEIENDKKHSDIMLKRFKNLMILNRFSLNHNEKKLITITPGGLKGFYVLGICSYIKDNYNLSDYVFSGASAGSWNSLFLSFKHDTKKIVDSIFDIEYDKAGSIFNVELMIKNKFITEFNDNDFNLDRVYIGSTIIDKCRLKSIVYSDFESLEDAVDCCMGSSHIPFISGSLYFVYKDKITFDGGISLYINESPYLPTKIPSLIINPTLFKDDISNNESIDLCEFYRGYFDSLDINKITDVKSMFDEGYHNAMNNKEALDEIFEKKFIN